MTAAAVKQAGLAALCIAACTIATPHATADGAPLHERIDTLIEAAAGEHALSPPADDAEFLRRAWLDFAGVIPSADEARAFLDDSSPDKRAKLIDALLDGEHYPRRMAELFHIMLMERRGDDEKWLAYLRKSFEENSPWDVMARQILNPPADNEAARGAGFFYVKRLENYGQNPVDYPGLTRDVGRLFAGQDLQCSQCHDDLFIDDYKQQHFQGMFVFFSNLSIRKDADFPMVNEGLVNEKLQFASVFNQRQKATGPWVVGTGEGEQIELPTYEGDEAWLVKPDRGKRIAGVPKFSPLAALAERLPTADNPLFARNMANRLWFVLMGRGIVHPLDLHHSDNPPSHPELLNALATDFASHGFDIKWLLRQIALSDAYQRSSLLPPSGGAEGEIESPPADRFVAAMQRRLSAEQLLWSTLRATGEYERIVEGNGEAGDGASPKLDDLRKRFLAAFANTPGEPEHEFAPSLKAALFLMNDEQVLSLLKRRPGNLIDRLAALDDAKAADELYVSVLTRRPTDEERSEAGAYLAEHKDDREAALARLAWALLASTEFCVNH